MIGKILGNRYEILEQLGGGGMAIVYKGRDTILNRLVTIKLLRPEYTSDDDFVRRFRREAQSVAILSNPNIVSIYDVGKEDNMHYLVMEYVDGEDLRSIIKREGLLDPVSAVKIARQICDALEHAHENNIVHRDVKSHNIIITRSGRAKLTDFGIAREASAATVTTSDTIVGSVHYLSPEQARGDLPDKRSDIYSLGVVLYEMLSGSLPFTGDSPISIALKHIQNNPDPLVRRNPSIPQSLEWVVMKALNKEPEKRFQSAREMSFKLEEALLNDDADITRVISLGEEDMRALKNSVIPASNGREKPRRRLKPAGWALVISLLVFLLAAGAYGYYVFVNVPEVKVPSVVGKPLEQAVAILAEKKLKNTVKEQYNSSVPEGHVISQEPGPNDPPVKVNRVIVLTVSKGPDLKSVPNVVGLDIVEARIRLTEEGFTMEEPPSEEHSGEVEKGRIISQNPAAYTRSPKDVKVKITVSKGPQPVISPIPDLRGMTEEQARTRLTAINLQIDPAIVYQTSTQYLRGQIVSHIPESGEEVSEGTTVKIYVSNGPGPSARDATVVVREIPDDGLKHVVRITVVDARGTNDVYIKPHSSGEQVEQTVRYWGRAAIKVFIDDKLIKEQVMN
ncbi:MAG: Stk1 family PASTA domain-containing Ser/Thr kinase [Bacillota bacterium]